MGDVYTLSNLYVFLNSPPRLSFHSNVQNILFIHIQVYFVKQDMNRDI